MAAQPVLVGAGIRIEARGGPDARKGRTARLELRAARVALLPPKDRAGEPDLSSVPIVLQFRPGMSRPGFAFDAPRSRPGAEDARTAVRRYRARWTIEEFFRVLKTGLKAEDRRFDSVGDLRKWGC